ncbi:quaternary amine ABC transporter ATP-binding protein [Streptomonospora salina]|uniref:Glycine betaine/proline transport system ATP-binding protein n=1 Tax=Streptomonospora salina TaxID=104205 RepID=A0A841E7A9_9ACTN|nr:betaine/proline/choline family ABC transporter ATP-binding protein [Streptomonospora salina]MBB5999827.1 glycine betaine/proline transport system ATP-binding protein [Streptomonospora salina]
MIEIRNLTKVFDLAPARARRALESGSDRESAVRDAGGVLAVDDVSFTVGRGELFAVMGLSGSGKSTVVRMINRLVEPTAGTVSFEGADVGSMTRPELRELRNRRISMVFQHFALFPHRTVRENAAYGLKARGVGKRERLERADTALDQVGLAHRGDAYPDEFSGGMKQRVGLARALTTDPDVLIMDEPFSALDPLTRRAMQEQLLQLQQDLGTTIVFVTHDLNEAMRIGDRIVVMKDGRPIQLATGPEIISDPATDYVRDFVSDVDRTRGLTASTVMQSPWVTAAVDENPADVLARLERAPGACTYVTDADGRIAGVATAEALVRAADEREPDLGSCVRDDYAAVSGDTPIVEFCHLTGGHAAPLAVVDGQRRLVGVLPRSRVMNAIAAVPEEVVERG